MSQFYDQASLVMVPSGYKAGKVYSQKPLSTDGQLTFTRNSNATRVVLSASGQPLVEKVRTNLALYSQALTTSWTNSGGTFTANNQTGPDGVANSASTFTNSNANSRYQTLTAVAGQSYTFSIYVKGDVAHSAMITSGVIGSTTNQTISVTTEWQRFNMTVTPAATNFVAGVFASNDSTVRTIYLANAQLEVSDFGPTDYIPTTSAAVSVGPTANVPRLNYSNGCPSLLLEPQRTNIIPYSEQLSQWNIQGATVTSNAIQSPDGYQNADLLTRSAGGFGRVYFTANVTGGKNTFSAYVKQGTSQKALVEVYDGAQNVYLLFNFSTLSFESYGSGLDMTDTYYEALANGWYRIKGTYTQIYTGAYGGYVYAGPAFGADGSNYWWGIQMELGSYATSYIPTLGASVTRLADDMDTTFGTPFATDGGGTFFLELDAAPQSGSNSTGLNFSLSFSSGDAVTYNHSGANYHRFRINAGGTSYYQIMKTQQDNAIKMAVKFTASSFSVYSNGSIDGTATAISGSWASATNLETILNDLIGTIPVKQMIFFPTALTDAQLAELTTL